MKIKLLLAFLFISSIAGAQTLELKAGQKFSYEGLNKSNLKNPKYRSSNYQYWKTNFEVIAHNNGIYTIKASPELFLTQWSDKILDSTVPFAEQPEEFSAIANKVISNSSYELMVDKNGNITAIHGVAKIKEAILAKLKELRTPEPNQKHQKVADMIVTDERFKMLSAFFKYPGKNLDTTFRTNLTDQTTSHQLKKEATIGNSSRLISSYTLDSATNTISATGAAINSSYTMNRFNLVSTDSKTKLAVLPLMYEAKITLNYKDYYTPINKAIRTIHDLADLFNKEKGSQTIEAEIMKRLSALDKGFAKDDYQYLGAKLGVLTYVGDGYEEILAKVPYEFLPDENDVENKMADDLERGDLSNVKKAVELCFTKFKGEDYYPMNMENASTSIHDQFGGLVYRMKDRDSLKMALNIIEQIEELKVPIATALFKGMKTYVQARLATDQNELTKIADIHFNSVFDKAGRYRILIYDELMKKNVPDSILLAYIDYTIDLSKKKIEMINSGSIENISPFTFQYSISPNKIVYKKNLADAYYRKSKFNKDTEAAYLQMAADYLPTQQDIVDNQFGLTAEYKFTPFIAYTDLYLASGGSSGLNDDAKLQKYVDMVIMEPERYPILKEKYFKTYPDGDFKAFFSAALKAKLPLVPQFSLSERSGMVVANKDQQNKFVFVDFWGTWCGSCVAEIDKIDAIHLKNPNPEKLIVTTIACFDKKKNVDDFMEKTKYTYQVLMSDGKVENDFKIRGYPTKLLLLPNGVYLTISYYSDYNDILNKYLKWEI
ncbi:TlpA family protein disulfide reductase [Pedobacter metabolipauper]|nr:TlpA disulfide reductase family protein [Pedobacter metabolipauper]